MTRDQRSSLLIGSTTLRILYNSIRVDTNTSTSENTHTHTYIYIYMVE